MLNKKWVILLAIVLALVLSACSTSNPKNNSTNEITKEDSTNIDTNQDNNTTNPSATTNIMYEDIKIVPEEAFEIFIKKYSNAKVEKIELELDHGSYVYEVEGYDDTKEFELIVNPIDGNILEEEQDHENNGNKKGELTLEDVNKIQDLIYRTLKDAGNDYRVDEWSLKSEDSQTIFEIEVVNDNNHDIEYEYDVDTGNLIEKEE